MDSELLYEMRKKLAEWRKHPPAQTISILKQIEISKLEPEPLNKSKILKTIHSLTSIDADKDIEAKQIRERAHNVVKKIKQVLSQQPTSPTTVAEQQQPKLNALTKQESNVSSKSLPDIDLFQNFKDTSSYVNRQKYLTGISKLFILNIQTAKDQKELCQDDLNTIKSIIEIIEKQIYYKRQNGSTARQLYEQDMKTLHQYLKRDKNGAVSKRLLLKTFDPFVAAQLRSNDWLDDFSKQQQQIILQEKIQSEQIGFYKELSKREMEGVEGKCCKGCGLKKVYLTEEKQTRASDEPTTKFFECFNCGDKFRIC